MQMFFTRYHRMHYPDLIYWTDDFFDKLEGYEGKEVLAGGLRHYYKVSNKKYAVTFWWKTAYVAITDETEEAENVLYSLHDPETKTLIACLHELFIDKPSLKPTQL